MTRTSELLPPGPLKEKLDQVPCLNAAIHFTCKAATVVLASYPDAPNSPAFFGAVVAVLAGKMDVTGVRCMGSQPDLGCAFWPGVKVADVIAVIKQVQSESVWPCHGQHAQGHVQPARAEHVCVAGSAC